MFFWMCTQNRKEKNGERGKQKQARGGHTVEKSNFAGYWNIEVTNKGSKNIIHSLWFGKKGCSHSSDAKGGVEME